MTATPAHAAEEEARVVILNGTDPYLPAYLEIDAAMRAALAQEVARHIVLFSQPLDAQRFRTEAFEPELTAYFAKKYKDLRIDVVVAVSQSALEFFRRHGADIWPGARVVFSGWPGEMFESEGLPADARAVVTSLDFSGTIDLARRLQPDARRIVVVSGASELDHISAQQARQALSNMTGVPPAEFLIGLPLPELVSAVAAEPADTIVLYLAQFRDRLGRPYTPREVLHAISARSVAPVYGVAETYLGFGMATGMAESYREHGRLIGQQYSGGAGRRATSSGPSRAHRTQPMHCRRPCAAALVAE